MSEERLQWQKIAGFALPMLLAWFSLAWMWVLMGWVSNNIKTDWTGPAIFLMWLVFVPVVSHAMGILSAYCWQYQQWDAEVRKNTVQTFSILFWVLSWPLTLTLFCSCVGAIVIWVQFVCYKDGVEHGNEWIEDKVLDKFWGAKNDWERDETD